MIATPYFAELGTALGLAVGMLLATELGYRLGSRRDASQDKPGDATLSTIQAAMLGLVGLLLGFSFASAGNRFIERLDIIVTEANAIGTAYLRMDLLEQPYRDQCKHILRSYTQARIDLFGAHEADQVNANHEQTERLHVQLWDAVIQGVRRSPQFNPTVLPPVNEVIDLHTKRAAMERRHIPDLVWGIVIGCSFLALLILGYGCGRQARRNGIITTSLALLMAAVLWLVIDMDYPRRGLLKINQQPMLELQQSLGVK